jgi:PAS domain
MIMEQYLQDALTYWESKRAGQKMPARRDFDPVLEIPKLVPWVVLVDVLRDPLDFRFRLIGTGIVDRSLRNNTGRLFSEMPQFGPGNHLWGHRATVVETCAPLRSEPPYVGRARGVRRVADIHLPLSEDGTVVNMIFTVVAFVSD